MKKLSIKEMLEEMENYDFTDEKIKMCYEDTNKEISFEQYIECFYNSDYYFNDNEVL